MLTPAYLTVPEDEEELEEVVAALPEVLTAALLVALGFGLLGEETPRIPAGRALVHDDGAVVLFHGNALPYPGFDALGFTMERYFGSVFSAAFTAVRAVCSLTWPVIFVLLVSMNARTWTAAINFVLLLALAAPIYVIAWDWGRFTVFVLIMALTLTARGVRLSEAAEVRWLARRAAFPRIPPPTVGASTSFVFALVFAPWNNYTQDGLQPWNAISYVVVIAIVGVATRPSAQAHMDSAKRAT